MDIRHAQTSDQNSKLVPFDYFHLTKGDPRSEIRGQLIKGFWQFSAELAETGWVGEFWPHMKIAKPKFPIFTFLPHFGTKTSPNGVKLRFEMLIFNENAPTHQVSAKSGEN